MMRKRGVRIVTVLAAVISVTVAPVFINLITANAALGWEKTTWTLSVVAASASLLVMIFGYREIDTPLSSSGEREQAAMQLIQKMTSIEQSASSILPDRQQNTPCELRQVSLRQIREAMLEIRIWTKEDSIGFDIALRARNAILHGDLKEVDMVDLKYAIEKTEQLLGKIQSFKNTEDK